MLFDQNDPTAIDVLRVYLQHARGQGRKIGLTSGSFDLIHFHHVLYFTRCSRYCDVLIVGVDSDELVRERKGEGRPVIYDSRRVVMVDAIRYVSFAFILNSVNDFGEIAQITAPDVIFKSDAFLGREHEVVGRQHAGQIKIIRDVVDYTSTTQILEEAARIATGKKSTGERGDP
jgi:D-beta-D-heptose 7-phosphate kinase/D-beta-D-heptose 1-phosphate adenosyltransferase